MADFIGRNDALALLNERFSSKTASLIVIRGRRRIGKSRLIREFGTKVKKAFYFSGLAPDSKITAEDQRRECIRQMAEQQIPSRGAQDWGDLFYDLAQFCKSGQVLIALDEITWMAQGDVTFLSKLKNAWDQYFKHNNKLILIISGSDSAWIEENILSKTGFFGRISLRLHLDELPLNHCAKFWGDFQNKTSSQDILKVLSITGGIPRYLEEINPKLSAEQNIFNLCYRPEGVLFNEFDDIFHDLFQKRSQYYKELIHCIAKGHKTIDEISQALNRSKGGDLSRTLDALCADGFLDRDYSWHLKTGKNSKINQFRLRDNYLRFYLKYIEPHKEQILKHRIKNLPQAWESIIGLQFENLVINNQTALLKQLKIPGQEVIIANPYLQTETKQRKKCQIDYLIQTKFNTLYICEIKFKKNEIDSQAIDDVKEKIKRLEIPKNFSYRCVLIHVNGVADSVLAEEYFSNIIDFSELLRE